MVVSKLISRAPPPATEPTSNATARVPCDHRLRIRSRMSTTLGKSYLSTLPMKIKKTVILSTSCRLDEIVQKLGVSATDASMLLVVLGTREAEMGLIDQRMAPPSNGYQFPNRPCGRERWKGLRNEVPSDERPALGLCLVLLSGLGATGRRR